MLIIWTGADAATIRKVMGPIVGLHSVQHRVEPDVTQLPHMKDGDVLLACGGKVLDTLLKKGLVPKGRTITSLRDKKLPGTAGSMFLTFDPSIVGKDYARLPEIQWDTQLAIRMHMTGSTKPIIGKYRYVESLHELIEHIDYEYERTGKPVVVAADLETKSLDEYDPEAWIIACSFTVNAGVADVLYFDAGECPVRPTHDHEDMTYWEGLWLQLNWLFSSPKVTLRGANFKYDSRWIHRKWGIDVTNLKMDTLLVGSLLDENRSNSLKLHAKIYTPMGGYEDDMKQELAHLGLDMGSLDRLPKAKLLPYVGGDTDATYQVSEAMRPELVKDAKLANFYVNLLHPSSKVFEKMERTGVCLDIPYYHRLKGELEVEIGRLDVAMKKLIPRKLAIKYQDNFSLTRPALMREFLFTPSGLNLKPSQVTAKGGEPSTAMDHLMTFEDVPAAKQFIDLLKESNSASKTLSTFVVGFLKHLRSDGRFHPSYRLARGGFEGSATDSGTVTGRCLTADSIILTGRGEVPIPEVVVGDVVWTHRNRWQKVLETYQNGVKPVFQVTTNAGAITCTGNHPVMSFPSWKLAEDLSPGDVAYALVKPPEAEEWKPIPDWPFEVSNTGIVRRATDANNTPKGSIVAQTTKGRWGHLKVTLTVYKNGGKVKIDYPVHRLVALAFLGGPPTSTHEVSHKNGVASCNWVTNLEWVTPAENHQQLRLHGSANKDSQKKVGWTEVDAMRFSSASDTSLAAKYGVSRELVRDIRAFKRWNGRREPMLGFAPVKVISVNPAGQQETYDLTIAEDHSFVANGLVVHNTSASDPAVQCLAGASVVATDVGLVTIRDLVERYERGEDFEVLTHTGTWRKVLGVYRNGVQPVFSVSSAHGTLLSTGNHPYLTTRGWVRTDALVAGDTGYAVKGLGDSASDTGVHQSHVPQLGGNEEPLQQRDQQGLASVRGAGDHPVLPVADIRGVSCGHGGEAAEGVVSGTVGCERELRAGKLCVGHSQGAGLQSTEHQADHSQRGDKDGGTVGPRRGYFTREATLPVIEEDANGVSLNEGDSIDLRVFQESVIRSITPAGSEETFDITVEGSHSFVANGLVVHNTVPKHTKWAKRLRRAMVPPPGKTILQIDYSQGELKIAACLADEPVMIAAYKNGADLHAITAAQLNGYSFQDFMLLPDDTRDELRSGGKAGNFGLIYGMGATGFQEYAYTTYGVKMTEQEASQKRTAFFELYKRLPAWHTEYKGFAKRWGQVRSPLGRIRHLPLITSKDREAQAQAERQSVNSPVQSCLSDMMQLAMVLIDREYGSQIDMFMMTHDACAFYVPLGEEVVWAKRLKAIMDNLPLKEMFGWDHQLQFTTDAECCTPDSEGVMSFAYLKKMKGL